MVRWNPGAVSVVGNEWRAWTYYTDRVEPIAAKIHSTATETVDSIISPYFAFGAPSSWGRMWAEIYNLADLGLNETPVVLTYLPNADVAVSGMFYTPIGGASTGPVSDGLSNLDQYINDLTDEQYPFANDDYLTVQAGAYSRFAFDSNTLPAGRVLSVSVEVRYESRTAGGAGSVGVDLYNNTVLTFRTGTANAVQIAGQDQLPVLGTMRTVEYYLNPVTSEPWTRADVISFSSGTGLLLQLTGVSGTVKVLALRLKVTMISEKRVAVGGNALVLSPPVDWNTTNFCALKTPAGADNWAKAAATDYLVVFRHLDDPRNAIPTQTQYFARIDSGAQNPDNQGHGYTITTGPGGRLLTAVGPETSAYAPMIARTDGALSVDSQPYWNLQVTRIYSGVTSNQRISDHGSTTYQTIRCVVGQIVGTPPNQNLTFQVKRVSDNVVMGGGTATLTPAKLQENFSLGNYVGVSWFDVQIDLSTNAVLVAGTQYYVEVASTAANATPWFVYALDETHGHVFTADQSFGGTVDYALVEGVARTQMDLVLTLNVPPPAGPASITVTEHDYVLPDNGGAACPAGVHQSARVAWAATGEGVLFARYEIQRSEDGGNTWATIKRIATEATVTFDDVTAARNVTLKYRVRTVRTSGLASSWRTQGNTLTLAGNLESVIFATNDNPALTVGYLWLNPLHRYEFLGDKEVNEVQLHPRDFSVMFRPTENRGTRFSFDLLIYARNTEVDLGGLPPSGKGDDAFAALRAVCEHQGPAVAVFTPFGKRIFAGVRVPNGDLEAEAALYTTTVTALQVSSSDAITDL